MDFEYFTKLENKLVQLVTELKNLRSENRDLKSELEKSQQRSQEEDIERVKIKEKVSSLLKLIDSIEDNGKED